ncbi:5754_t:CDS:2 [Funneliformis geosporum]|uniref:5754_t:CDS:1 n=1 Tax=Funneliformis geosporum TaxID=1117311 RepID=A0A9W4T521_9GLOM|nr:5754_t:CDS:2 [Funneliformis geosporum]
MKAYISLKIRESTRPISESLKDKKTFFPFKKSADAFRKEDKTSVGSIESDMAYGFSRDTDGTLMGQMGYLGHIWDIVETYSWDI